MKTILTLAAQAAVAAGALALFILPAPGFENWDGSPGPKPSTTVVSQTTP